MMINRTIPMSPIIAFLVFVSPISAKLPIVAPEHPLDRVGDCSSGAKDFDLRRLMLLENRTVVVDSPSGPLRVAVNGEDIEVQNTRGGPRAPLHSVNVGNAVDENNDLDVELRLALLNAELVVYWKETYQHRVYRQGLFQIVGETAVSLCTGHGGVTTVD
jgi:hypothetical protein